MDRWLEPIVYFFTHLLDPVGFSPRWFCGTGWQPITGWFMIISDLLIFGAYISIPFILVYFLKKKPDITFPRILWLFAAFIFFCGISHLLDALIFWWPVYRFSAFERFWTAVVSWATVMVLIPIVPKALTLRSSKDLEREIREREVAEAALKELNETLERQVVERTHALNEKAWQLETINKELETFSYSVSHDLKAPLRRIGQFIELIQLNAKNNPLNTDQLDYLGRIAVNTQQMSDLIEDLLRFSRVTNAPLKQEHVSLSALVEKIVRELKEDTPDRGVDVRIQPGVQTIGDSILLEAMLQNLLNNAWKYTSKTEQGVIEFYQADSVDGNPVYCIRDNGVGFDPQYAERLFQPFQRLHRREDFPGTGIGLANVQRIIIRHGGRVWAESQPAQGASFYFTLPVAGISATV